MSIDIVITETRTDVNVTEQMTTVVDVSTDSRDALFLRGLQIGDVSSIINGQVLAWNSGASQFLPATGGGGGNVTSVGLTVPSSLFAVSGSPITSSGVLALSLQTQTANQVFAGPTTGAAATPTFRALVAADIPGLSNYLQGTIANTQIVFGTGGGTIGGSPNLTWNGNVFYVGTPQASFDPYIQNWGPTHRSASVALVGTDRLSGLNITAQSSVAEGTGGVNGIVLVALGGDSYGIDASAYTDQANGYTRAFSGSMGVRGAITTRELYTFYAGFPDFDAGSTVPSSVAFYAVDQTGADNAYYFWGDSQGVYRIKEDATFNGVGQAIPALYNPQFTKYTAGTPDFERIVYYWDTNVATFGTQAGGTGTLRVLNLIGSSVTVNGVAAVTTTGAQALSNKSGSISQWTNDSGYLTSVTNISGNAGTATALQTARAINGVSFDGTAAITITAAAGTLSGATLASGVTASSLTSFGASPSLTTPTIASFANATHTHLNAAGGGTLTAAAVTDLNSATIAFTNKSGNISQWTNDSAYLTSVTAHNILSATHGDTLAGAVVRGDLIYGNATPKWARLAAPGALSGLSHDGTDVSWVAATGTGAPVRASSPTIVTPTVASFANATHTHLNAAGGGTLTAAAISDLSTNAVTSITGTANQVVASASTGAVKLSLPQSIGTGSTPTFAGLTLSEAVGSTALTLTGATQTVSHPVLSATQTWNAGAVIFTGWKLNVTNTASSNASKLLDLQIASASKFAIGTAGELLGDLRVGQAGAQFSIWCTNGTNAATQLAGGSPFGWTSSSGDATGTLDTIFRRAAAAVIQCGSDVNGAAVSQTLQAANGITGTDRTGGNFTLASGKGTGAGAVSSLIFQTPTVLTTGTTAQSLATRVTIASGSLTLADATDFVFNTTTGTKHGTAASQKQSFWNVTPIVQPTTGVGSATQASGGGAAVNLLDTYDGYTIAQVVKALRNTGLLA